MAIEDKTEMRIVMSQMDLKRNNIKINVLSEGRFHMLDLARELAIAGYDVKFYSFVPKKRSISFGLPKECATSIVLPLSPFLALDKKIFPKHEYFHKLRVRMQDLIVTHAMRKCDVLISLTGSYVKAVEKAKESDSLIIMERGSKHILEQKRIMEEICGADSLPVPQFNVERELQGYELADYISIASMHVERSFLLHGFPKERLFRNPYGTDLSMFAPLPDVKKEFDVIMVGGWSRRKGCDILIEALKDTAYKFLHVGGLVDMEFPTLPNFVHIDSVDQRELIQYYNKAKVAVLASKEEGLAMVQGQAIACGLPLVCTEDTGGEDLRDFLDNELKKFVIVVKGVTVKKIKFAIDEAIGLCSELPVNRDYMRRAKDDISWRAYGKRYAAWIDKIYQQRTNSN